MKRTETELSSGRRIIQMSLTWLMLGGVIGVIGSRPTDPMIGIASSMLSGMIVLSFAGVILGLIGGDVKGTPLGAAGALFGCWLSQLSGAVSIDPVDVKFVVLVGALAGATGSLYLRLVLWTYKTIFRTTCRLFSLTRLPENVFGRIVRFGYPSQLATVSVVHFTVPPIPMRSGHRLDGNPPRGNDRLRTSIPDPHRDQGNSVGGCRVTRGGGIFTRGGGIFTRGC
jgi:hypothetical protein